ncbi:hypothetical protein CRENBAI_010727 [Crenichthys baileyi]|uniref:Uncharacterized protein n=1 Tax=Crenichthys baileyi TaxID=28760 RepID=A0AAV9RRQ6_9TELE
MQTSRQHDGRIPDQSPYKKEAEQSRRWGLRQEARNKNNPTRGGGGVHGRRARNKDNPTRAGGGGLGRRAKNKNKVLGMTSWSSRQPTEFRRATRGSSRAGTEFRTPTDAGISSLHVGSDPLQFASDCLSHLHFFMSSPSLPQALLITHSQLSWLTAAYSESSTPAAASVDISTMFDIVLRWVRLPLPPDRTGYNAG